MPTGTRLRAGARLYAAAVLLATSFAPLAQSSASAQTPSSFDKSSGGSGQAYPTKPVRVIVTFAPGGSADIVARLISPKLTRYFGQPFVIDNRGGAGGSIGVDIAVKAAPDGHTLIVVSGSYAANAAVYRQSFDPVTGIAPIIEVGFSPHIVAVHPSIPARTVKELIALGKAKPGQLNYPSSGTGGLTHLATELFANMGGFKITHVPYRSIALGLVDVVSGQLQMVISSMPPTLPHVKSGKLNAIAVTTAQRWPSTPEYPTVAESLPGYDVELWFGVWAPKGTPAVTVERLNAAINKAIREDDMQQQFTALGILSTGGEPKRFVNRVRRDVERWNRVVQQAGIKPDS